LTAKSHVLTSLAIAISPMIVDGYYIVNNDMGTIATYLASVVFGALFPDIDEERSYIGSRFKFLSKSLNRSIGHRTYTHNILVYLPLLFYGFYVESYILFGFSLGAILHVLEDSITNNGVKGGLRPLFKKLAPLPKSLMFNTNMFFEKAVYLPLVTLLLFFELYVLASYMFNLKAFL